MMSFSSPSVFTANRINQQINNFLWIPVPLEWVPSKLQWKFSSNKILPYFVFSLALKLINISINLFLIHHGYYKLQIFKVSQLLPSVVLTLALVSVGILEILNFLCGHELVCCLNWCIKTNEHISKLQPLLLIQSHFNKMIGYISIIMVVLPTLGAFLISLLLVLTDSDPLFLFLYYFDICATSLILKVLRICYMVYIGKMCVLPVRIFSNTILIAGFFRVYFLNVLLLQKPTIFWINIYRQLSLISKIVRAHEYILFEIGSVLIFLLFVLSFNAVLLAIRLQKIILALLAFYVLLAVGFIFNTAFEEACAFYVLSERILILWKASISKLYVRHSVRFMTRLLNSMAILATPVGDAGVADKDIKMNYLDKTLNYTVNSIVTIDRLVFNKI